MKIIGKLGTGMAYSGVFIFILGFLVPSNYLVYFLVTGAIVGGLGIYIIFSLDKKDDNKALKEYNEWKQKLISTGTLIEVPSEQCEVKSSTYVREKDVDFDSYGTEIHNSITGGDHSILDNKDQNVIMYSTTVGGEGITFYSPIILKEKNTLEFLLSSNPTTKLYVDQFNKSNFYWDLEFLREN
jgi:hypothetical protein